MKPLATRPPGRPRRYSDPTRIALKTERALKAQLEAAAKSAGKTLTDFLLGAAFALLGSPALASQPVTPQPEIQDVKLQSDRLSGDLQPQVPDVPAALELGERAEERSGLRALESQPTLNQDNEPAICAGLVGGDSGSGDLGEEDLSGVDEEEARGALPMSRLSRVPEGETLKSALGLFVKCSQCNKKRANVDFKGKPYCSECSLSLPWARLEDTPPLPAPEEAPCEVCSSRRFTLTEEKGKIVASRCSACLAACSLCKDSGWVLGVRNGYEAQIACSCARASRETQIRNLNAVQLPGVYAGVLFGKLPPKAITESQRRAHQESFEWTRTFDPKKPNAQKGFFFWGPAGTGKTLALCRAAALVAKNTNATARYINLPLYLQAQKDSWNNPEIEVDAVTELLSVDVLIVDEILLKGKNGAPRPLGDWERRQLDVLVHGRWQAGKITHYATNYRPDQIEAEVTESTFSRIRSGCEFLEVEGADLRNGELIDIKRGRGLR